MLDTKNLMPIYEMTKNNKETFLSLVLSDILDKIEKRCKNFVQVYFIDKPIGYQFELRNLINDLEYLFSEGLFFINLVQDAGFEISGTKFFIERYIQFDKDGYKSIVSLYVHKYNRKENRLYTDDELKKHNKKMSEIALKVLKKMKNSIN